MFKKKLFCAGPVSRCRFAPLLLLACLAFAFSSSLQAQEHGAGLTKVCGPPARTCDTASDCADGDLCTDDVCTDSPANTLYNCTFTFRHLDEFGDTLSLYDAFDTITNNVGAPTVIPLADLLVIAISGNATCSGVNAGALPAAANTVLPCAVGPATTIPVAISGRVQFRSNTYSPTMADYNAITPELDGRVLLRDSATGKAKDLCDAVGTAGCNTVDDIVATGVSSQEIVTGCENPPSECDDGNACTTEACNPDTGQCEVTDEVACDDGDACTSEACDPADGVCKTTDEVACDDGDACTSEACDPADGVCKTTDEVACDDGDACTSEACDPADGVCKTTDEVACDDGDVCTDDSCNPDTGLCVSVPAEDPPAECLGAEICRTPGFWGTHGGTEKRNSTNITQAVIDEAGGLLVCGESITDTHLGHTHSALEAICVSVKGAQELQLARQLTAAALNCVMSGGPADCTGISIEELYADCNVACVGGDSDRSITECIEEVDCFNNGGEFVAGECKTGVGTCDVSGAACDDDTPCTGLGDTMCVPFETCHDRDLCPDFTDDGELNGSDFCFEPPGAAGSSGACNAATKNTLSIFD